MKDTIQYGLPYSRHQIDRCDIDAVLRALTSKWLTTGPLVAQFEAAMADRLGTTQAVAVSSGTAALHAMFAAVGIGPNDQVIVPALTFVASANAVLYCGGQPVFADICPRTMLIDPQDVRRKITANTRAVLGVDYAGQPCDYAALRDLCTDHNLWLLADCCHSLGASYAGRTPAAWADASCYSFHAVKPITTGEGGMVATNRDDWAGAIRRFRNHGIDSDFRQRSERGTWQYDMQQLGFNYRITDLQCALGLSQLERLDQWTERRRQIAARYDQAFEGHPVVQSVQRAPQRQHAYHLYPVLWNGEAAGVSREQAFASLRKQGIGVNVHYAPVYLHSYYRKNLGCRAGLCPVAEQQSQRLLSLPIFPGMCDHDIARVLECVRQAAAAPVAVTT